MAYPPLMPFDGPLQGETWKAVGGFPHYEVSDFGRIRTLEHLAEYKRRGAIFHRKVKARLLRPGAMKSGHLLVILMPGRITRLVHHLVLETFVGMRPAGTESLHGDGDPGNNRLTNLRWGTRAENVADARRHGTMPLGDSHPGAILKSTDIPTIRLLLASKTQRQVGEIYGVSRSTILNIKRGKTWAHVA